MTIYTSNYARHGRTPTAIAISAAPPDWFTGMRLPALAPTWNILNAYKHGNMTEKEYTIQYLHLLLTREFDPEMFVSACRNDTFLLCYESPGDFCHRRILAEWIELKTGVTIPEWKNEKELAIARQAEAVDSFLDF